MTRRDALKASIGALLGAYIAPAPRPAIDLRAFCARRPGLKWDMRLPYHLDDWTYATDAAVCVRVAPVGADRVERAGEVPPVEKLSWNHRRLRGWQPLPDVPALPAANTPCPTCDGYGCMGTPVECSRCDGMGENYEGDWDHMGKFPDCTACAGVGLINCGPTCPTCKGVKPVGVRPGIVKVGGAYFDAELYRKVSSLGGEFVLDNAKPGVPLLKFRFHGGDGLLMGLNQASAERRLEVS